MILLLGTLADPAISYICTRLASSRETFLVLDTRLYPDQLDLTWSFEQGNLEGKLRYGSTEMPLDAVRAVYVRSLAVKQDQANLQAHGLGPVDPTSPRGTSRPLSHETARQTLAAFANTLPALVVNRPAAGYSNGSKPYQQQVIARHGFHVPRTLVTSVPEEVRRFYEACQGRVIFKSASHVRSIVKRLTAGDLSRAEQVRTCPTQFQEFIAGTDIRVHTVGSRIFATEITCDATDYRYAGRDGSGREMRAIELPVDLHERCLTLAADLDLVFSGIDLRRTPEGAYYCFEVNSSPAFTFYQSQSGQRIGDALGTLLRNGFV